MHREKYKPTNPILTPLEQGRIREEGMQQSTSKNRMGGGMLLEEYSNI